MKNDDDLLAQADRHIGKMLIIHELNVTDLFSRADRITKVKRLPVHAVWKPERPAL